jgi:transcription antitermination factor NusG
MSKKWYAVHTKPRWEKKVALLLGKSNISHYCPLNRVLRQWSDRRKLVYEPLFKSYVFVHISDAEHKTVRCFDGVINFVYWLGRPAVIKEVEIEAIKHFLEEYNAVLLEKASVNVNDEVRIVSGPLIEQEGTVILVSNNKVKVTLPSLGYTMIAEINKSEVEVVVRRANKGAVGL